MSNEKHYLKTLSFHEVRNCGWTRLATLLQVKKNGFLKLSKLRFFLFKIKTFACKHTRNWIWEEELLFIIEIRFFLCLNKLYQFDDPIMSDNILTFVPISSVVNPTFWYKLAEIKLDVDGLNDAEKRIYGQCAKGHWHFQLHEQIYHCRSIHEFELPRRVFQQCRFVVIQWVSSSLRSHTGHTHTQKMLDVHSVFCRVPSESIGYFVSHGVLHNKNTIEEFRNCDKVALMNDEGRKIWQSITDGSCIDNPSLFVRFFVLSFAVSFWAADHRPCVLTKYSPVSGHQKVPIPLLLCLPKHQSIGCDNRQIDGRRLKFEGAFRWQSTQRNRSSVPEHGQPEWQIVLRAREERWWTFGETASRVHRSQRQGEQLQ